MLRINDIKEAMLGLIGWQQTSSTLGAVLCDTMTDSESGLYFQQSHPLITLDNLVSIAPDFSKIETTGAYPSYGTLKRSQTYKKGSVVSYAGKLYKAIQDTIGGTPDMLPDYWAETNLFSEWLEEKTKASIAKAINRYYTEKLANRTAKSLCENKTLFDGTGRLSDTITNRNNLVGFEIVQLRAKGITTKINKIGLQFTEPGDYFIYIMHSSSNVPVRTLTLTKKNKGFEWIPVKDLFLPYQGDNTDAGGSWYVCYKQTELPENSKAINKNKDWSKGPCRSCSRNEYQSWQAWSRFLEVHPFSVKEEFIPMDYDVIGMWDIEKNVYDYNYNYGINLDISIYCDLTDFVIEHKTLFQDIIFKQVAIDFLREFAYNSNVRTNRHSINASRLDILYEIDGDSSSMKEAGLNYEFANAMKAIELDTRGIDRACLPCKNNGVKYRTV